MNAKRRSQPNADQSAHFAEAAKKAGGDQKSFEKAFKRVVPTRTKQKSKS
jgi:hypothetical protein